MPPVLDAFGGDPFTAVSLTAAMNIAPFKPGRIGEMGLFKPKGIRTTTAMLEEVAGVLRLLSAKSRHAPPALGLTPKRKARVLPCLHIPYNDTIMADDAQDVRTFGSESTLQGVSSLVNDKLEQMRQDHEVTLEYLRIGALHGLVKDGDGSTTLYDLFQMFEVTEQTQDFAFGTATTDVRGLLVAVKRLIENELGGASMDHVHGFAGDAWWDAYVSHALVKAAFDRWQDGAFLRTDARKGFEFAGVVIENYRGSVGGTSFIDTDQCRFFPVGVPNLYLTAFAPATFIEAVNTIGLPYYAKQRMLEFETGVEVHTQSNPLPVCLIPKLLIKATKS